MNITSSVGSSNIFQYVIFLIRIFEYNIKRSALPFPSAFCIQTINACNASCIMCPLAQTAKKRSIVLSEILFEKIIKEIIQEHLKFTHIYLFLQNEPLMDKDIFKRFRLIKRLSNGKIKTGLVTNGSLFAKEKIKELEQSELDELIFSIDALTEETYKKVRQGLNFQVVIKNIKNIIDSNFNGHLAVKFVVQKDNMAELEDFKKYWLNNNIPVQITDLRNRAGDLNSFDELRLEDKKSTFFGKIFNYVMKRMIRGCSTPLTTFNIMSNGDVILCCDDFSNKLILGNVNESTIKEIWNSKDYKKIREMLFKGEYEKIPACRTCSKIVR
jgi:radical SAM protein with 4Fe4S-binding SPASM domain